MNDTAMDRLFCTHQGQPQFVPRPGMTGLLNGEPFTCISTEINTFAYREPDAMFELNSGDGGGERFDLDVLVTQGWKIVKPGDRSLQVKQKHNN